MFYLSGNIFFKYVETDEVSQMLALAGENGA